MTQIMIEIPDELISRLPKQNDSLQEIIIQALKNYLQSESLDIPQTRTWKLCGRFKINQPDPKFIIGENSQGQMITNYAENIDETLY